MRTWYYKHKDWVKAYDTALSYMMGETEEIPYWNPDITDEWSEEFDGCSELIAEDKEGAVSEFWTDVYDSVYCYVHDC